MIQFQALQKEFMKKRYYITIFSAIACLTIGAASCGLLAKTPLEVSAQSSYWKDTTMNEISELPASYVGQSGNGSLKKGDSFNRRGVSNGAVEAAQIIATGGYIYDEYNYKVNKITEIKGVYSYQSPWKNKNSIIGLQQNYTYAETDSWSFHSDYKYDFETMKQIGAKLGLGDIGLEAKSSNSFGFSHSFGYSYTSTKERSISDTITWNIDQVPNGKDFTIGLVGTYYVVDYSYNWKTVWSTSFMLWIPATNQRESGNAKCIIANPANFTLTLLVKEGKYASQNLYKYLS